MHTLREAIAVLVIGICILYLGSIYDVHGAESYAWVYGGLAHNDRKLTDKYQEDSIGEDFAVLIVGNAWCSNGVCGVIYYQHKSNYTTGKDKGENSFNAGIEKRFVY